MTCSSLIDSLKSLSQTKPQKVAYIYLGENGTEQEKITYSELYLRVSQAAYWLNKNDFSGSSALLIYPQGIEFGSGFVDYGEFAKLKCPIHVFVFSRRLMASSTARYCGLALQQCARPWIADHSYYARHSLLIYRHWLVRKTRPLC